MSGVSLSDYFEAVRPSTYDICVIALAVIGNHKKGIQIITDMNHIRYDAYRGKIYMTARKNRMEHDMYTKGVERFFLELYRACKHAGDGTDIFAGKLCELVRKKEYDACMRMAGKYMSHIKKTGGNNKAVYMLCAVTVILYEILYLLNSNVKF